MANQAYRTLEVMINGLWRFKCKGTFKDNQIFNDLYDDIRRELNRPGYSADKVRVGYLRRRYDAFMQSL